MNLSTPLRPASQPTAHRRERLAFAIGLVAGAVACGWMIVRLSGLFGV